jgi:hypothetical protein
MTSSCRSRLRLITATAPLLAATGWTSPTCTMQAATLRISPSTAGQTAQLATRCSWAQARICPRWSIPTRKRPLARYHLADGSLLTFNSIENIICFTPGTLIATPMGGRDIATLQVGDLVMTRDNRLQPIHLIQSSTVEAKGRFAPRSHPPRRHHQVRACPDHVAPAPDAVLRLSRRTVVQRNRIDGPGQAYGGQPCSPPRFERSGHLHPHVVRPARDHIS